EAAAGRAFAEGTIGRWLLAQPGRPAADAPDEGLAAWTEGLLARGDRPVHLTRDADGALRQAPTVVTAPSTAGEVSTPELMRRGPVVCDMSRPPNVSRRVEAERPDVLVLDGGVIEVPGKPWFGWDFGYERGLAYACMSETMMLALERDYRDTSLGTDL